MFSLPVLAGTARAWHRDFVSSDDPVQVGMAQYLASTGQLSWSDVERIRSGMTSQDFDSMMSSAQGLYGPYGPPSATVTSAEYAIAHPFGAWGSTGGLDAGLAPSGLAAPDSLDRPLVGGLV